MDIKILKEMLTTLNLAGIVQAIFEPVDDNKTLIQGSNGEKNILIFDTIDHKLVDLPMGIQSIAGLLSRINLFDEDKAKLEPVEEDGMVKELTIKQGRRKASFRLDNPLTKKGGLNVPRVLSENIEDVQSITFSEEYVRYVSSVISSMAYTGIKKERQLTLESDVNSNATVLKISDGEFDSFVDELDVDGVELNSQAGWEVTPFERMLKQSMEVNPGKKATFGISENHVAVFDLGVIRALVVPLH